MIARKSVIAVIPARGGSKGLTRKNLRPVAGKPLIEWTFKAAAESRFIDRIILSTDDPEISAWATELSCEVPFRRPDHLATDDASSIDVVCHAVNEVAGYDIVVLLQPTSPLRSAADIDAALSTMERSSAPACVSVRKADDHPYLVFSVSESGVLMAYVPDRPVGVTRRQDLPPAWCLNGAVYCARIPWLLEKRTFVSSETVPYIMKRDQSIDVDDYEDLLNAERALLER
jgi:CMP-N,N'-diacetyllegionaminic acid synthase